MKIQVLQENLSKAVSTASRFSSSRAQLPVLANILLSVEKSKLVISATNLEISVSIPVGAKVEEEGEITIPAKTLSDIVVNLNPGTLELTSEKEVLTIKQGAFKSSLVGMNASDFPSLPKNLGKGETNTIDAGVFSKALTKVLFSATFDETRPTLTGVLCCKKKADTYLVSTDGFRLSKKKIITTSAKPSFDAIVPKNVLSEIPRFFTTTENLEYSFDGKEKQVVFKIDGSLVSSRLIEGDFPDFEKIIPKEHSAVVNVDKNDFYRAVKLASVFARDSANVVKLEVQKDRVGVASESQYAGEQKNSFEAKVEGEGLTVAFNYKFLEDFVQSVEGESIVMEFSGPQSPGVFKDPSDPDYLHLIMPVKI